MWGLQRADELGLPIYLEATSEGKPLYEKFGFQTAQVTTFELSKYGGSGTEVRTIMIRQAKGEKDVNDFILPKH
jgi:hypothetical protein